MSKLKEALDKARQYRESNPESYVPQGSIVRDNKILTESVYDEVNPVYTRTQIQNIDIHALQEKRIISIHHCNAISDRYKLLRTQVMTLLKDQEKNSILIASANHKEGRTTSAINLAVSLAQQLDNTVLLVDADLKEPSIHKILGLTVEKGLSDCLRGAASIQDVLINPGIERLVILPGGKRVPNSAEVLGSPRSESVIQELKDRYRNRYIIFDSPPVLVGADSLILSSYVDAILIVIEAERTTKNDLLKMKELLGGKPVIGSIFTKVRQ
ncbi:MAG: polysaccharide biosynthesis tyrosine autokinase [Deltaproteobacteria bacterium]|nr:polysaccharide biosynthesis tyrosine autokinase [Deltaproteobacteria bacterium]